MKKTPISVIFFLISSGISSQNSKLEYGIYNITLGGLSGGFGALINKKKEEKPLKTFGNGFWKGCIGGGTIHLSKINVGEVSIKNNYSYSWLAKINNSLGTLFVENATLNRPLLSNFHINILGFNRIEISTQNKFKIRYKLMPTSFLLSTYVMATSKFEFNKTIATGELIFSSNKATSINYRGYTIGTTIVLNSDFKTNKKSTISHELIHVYQYYDYNFLNSFVNRPLNKLTSKSKFLSKIDFLYYDIQYPFLIGLYSIEKSKPKYYDNFFEKEAGFYSNTLRDY